MGNVMTYKGVVLMYFDGTAYSDRMPSHRSINQFQCPVFFPKIASGSVSGCTVYPDCCVITAIKMSLVNNNATD